VIRAGFERLVPNFRAEQAGLFPRSLQAFSPASSCRLSRETGFHAAVHD